MLEFVIIHVAQFMGMVPIREMNMKKLLAMLTLVASLTAFAGDVDDFFGGGEDQFDFQNRFSDADILMQVDRDAAVACYGSLCTLHSVTNRYGGFEVEFTVGENLGNSSSGGAVIITGGKDGYDTCDTCNDGISWGVTVRYKKGQCTQTINVPKSVYYAINTYMYGLIDEGGATRRGFTPADEAMIMFYTTIMSKASGCQMQ